MPGSDWPFISFRAQRAAPVDQVHFSAELLHCAHLYRFAPKVTCPSKTDQDFERKIRHEMELKSVGQHESEVFHLKEYFGMLREAEVFLAQGMKVVRHRVLSWRRWFCQALQHGDSEYVKTI